MKSITERFVNEYSKNQRDFENWLEKEQDNLIAHAEGGSIEEY